MYMKLILYGIMGFDVFLTAAGEKALNRFSFIVKLFRYLIDERQLLFYRRLLVVTLFCVLWLVSCVLK